MTQQAGLEDLKNIGLYPHQAQFVLDFLKTDSLPFHWLVAQTGTGSTTTIREVIRQIIVEQNAKHILVLIPAALQDQFFHLLQDHTSLIPLIQVNRKILREIVTRTSPNTSPWSDPVIAIVGLDFAKQDDVATSLSSVKWDLIVIDEAHQLAGKRKALLNRLIETDKASRLLLCTHIDLSNQRYPLNLSEFEKTTWERETVIDWDGQPLFLTKVSLGIIEYERSPEEVHFLHELHTLSRDALTEERSIIGLGKSLLSRIASSSLYAIEQSLLRRRQQLESQLVGSSTIESEDDYIREEEFNPNEISVENFDSIVATSLTADLGDILALLEALDQIPTDTKLQAFLALVADLRRTNFSSHICIFSSYATTVSYIVSSLKEIYDDVYQFMGATPYEERNRIIYQFTKQGGIFVGSSAALTGVRLDIDVSIHYDLPSLSIEMERRLAVLSWLNSARSLHKMYFLKDKSNILPFEQAVLRALQYASSSKMESSIRHVPVELSLLESLELSEQVGQENSSSPE